MVDMKDFDFVTRRKRGMTRYLFRNILIYGSDPSRHEKAACLVILIALFILTAWLDPV